MKVTRTEGATPRSREAGKQTWGELGESMEPGAALGYARWMLADERGWSREAKLHRRAEDPTTLDRGSLASAFEFLAECGGAGRLSAELTEQLSETLGFDAARIRLHTDERAAAAAALAPARAFTLGEDIYFAAGAYDPGSERGLELVAHEAAHVAQYQRGAVSRGSGASLEVSQPDDAHELEADELARRFLVERGRRRAAMKAERSRDTAALAQGKREQGKGGAERSPVGETWWSGAAASRTKALPETESGSVPAETESGSVLGTWGESERLSRGRTGSEFSSGSSMESRFVSGAGVPPLGAPRMYRKASSTASSSISSEATSSRSAARSSAAIDLLGASTFAPAQELSDSLEKSGREGAPVRVKLGGLGSGVIQVRRAGERYFTIEDQPQVIPLSHPLFVPLPGFSPVVRVRIGAAGDSAITGYVAPADTAGREGALQRALVDDPERLGLRGFELPSLRLTNQLERGALTLASQQGARFGLGGWVQGTLAFGLSNSTATVDATAQLRARGLRDAELRLTRDGQGLLRGSAELAIDLGEKFAGRARATYEEGDVSIKGEVSYASEKLRGTLGLIVAETSQAVQLVRAQLDPAGVHPVARGGAGSRRTKRASDGERGIAGWGELDFAFTDWLTGKAMVVYGPTGHLTVIGKVAPPQRLDLMREPKGIKRQLLPQVNVEASYGLPYVADVHAGVGVSLSAKAELGPISMTDLSVEGTYSTDPAVMSAFTITGALRAQAHAGLELDVKGYAGLRVLKHSVNVGAGIKGEAGLRAYAEARSSLGYREVASPAAGKRGEYYLKGHLDGEQEAARARVRASDGRSRR